ncbi:hypothetical protein HK102_006613 [Quaeritorhiza haematococci]|nr:hypothetical protein HK102_006613 [Quaeritorhiza haematococci]
MAVKCIPLESVPLNVEELSSTFLTYSEAARELAHFLSPDSDAQQFATQDTIHHVTQLQKALEGQIHRERHTGAGKKGQIAGSQSQGSQQQTKVKEEDQEGKAKQGKKAQKTKRESELLDGDAAVKQELPSGQDGHKKKKKKKNQE